MSTTRTAWHVMFLQILEERKPSSFEVSFEVPLSAEPQRIDYLLLRKTGDKKPTDALVLRGLWPKIKRNAIVELKTVSRPLRQRDLPRLIGYGWQHFTAEPERLKTPEDLLLVLIIPKSTPTLVQELELLGATVTLSKGGYALVKGFTFPMIVVLMDEVSKAERDSLLGHFSGSDKHDAETIAWWARHLWSKEKTMTTLRIEELEGYDEIISRFLETLPVERRLKGLTEEQRLKGLTEEQRLKGLTEEQRLKGLTEEQRLKGLTEEQRLKGLTEEQRLKGLTEEQLRNLQRALNKRLDS